MLVIESMNIKIDDYLPFRDHSRLEVPPSSSLSEEGNTLTDPKDVPKSDSGDSCPISVEV